MNITNEVLANFFIENKIYYIPTQQKLCVPIINRMYKKMKNGIRFETIKVCNNLIIDGHHRYVSSLLANIATDISPTLKPSSIKQYNWTQVDFLSEEWDTAHKILHLNELDAKFNNIPLDKIIELTK